MSDLQAATMHPDSTPQPAPLPERSIFSSRGCGSCGKEMALRDARDYGLPDDVPRQLMRVVWWECPCGNREVVARDILS